MAFFDTAIVVALITFFILVVWSRVMGQSMYDTIIEIKDIIGSLWN